MATYVLLPLGTNTSMTQHEICNMYCNILSPCTHKVLCHKPIEVRGDLDNKSPSLVATSTRLPSDLRLTTGDCDVLSPLCYLPFIRKTMILPQSQPNICRDSSNPARDS